MVYLYLESEEGDLQPISMPLGLFQPPSDFQGDVHKELDSLWKQWYKEISDVDYFKMDDYLVAFPEWLCSQGWSRAIEEPEFHMLSTSEPQEFKCNQRLEGIC